MLFKITTASVVASITSATFGIVPVAARDVHNEAAYIGNGHTGIIVRAAKDLKEFLQICGPFDVMDDKDVTLIHLDSGTCMKLEKR